MFSVSHLLTVLFVRLLPLGWQKLLRFRIQLSAFLPQYSPPWSVHHMYHRCLKNQRLWLDLHCDPVSSSWLVISGSDPWCLKCNIAKTELIFFSRSADFPNTHIKPSLFYIWIMKQSPNTRPTYSSTTPIHLRYCCLNNYHYLSFSARCMYSKSSVNIGRRFCNFK